MLHAAVQVPYRMVVARELQEASGGRSGLHAFSLKDRRYLGPTSMDHELSCIMCNHGHVRPGSFVLDPFAGTGSILVAAASYGARVLGCDIDMRVLRDGKIDSKGASCNVYTNFRDYGLGDPAGLVRCDNSHPPWRPHLQAVVDAILTDPPYGVRAGAM
jgi:tRNA (guanine10-N2)-methyltransferase